jgi:hypothetical protein
MRGRPLRTFLRIQYTEKRKARNGTTDLWNVQVQRRHTTQLGLERIDTTIRKELYSSFLGVAFEGRTYIHMAPESAGDGNWPFA